MKKRLLLVILLAVISGCTSYGPDSLSTFLYGPPRAPEEDVVKMSDLAWVKHQSGAPINTACLDARTQLNIKSRSSFLDTSECERRVKARAHERSLENERLARHANEQRKADEFERRIASIRAGNSEVYTEAEAAVIYQAADGQHLASRPLVQPDNKKYIISGFLDAADGLRSDRLLIRTTEFGEPRYVFAQIEGGAARLPDSAQAESRVFIVGVYVKNLPYTTIQGEQRVMPLFRTELVRTR